MIRKVLAIIVDYRSREDAEALSLQVARIGTSDLTVHALHVDNGNASASALSEAQRELGVLGLRLDRNHGYAGAINRAIEVLGADGYDAYWFLNSDLRLVQGCLERMISVLNSHPRVAAVGPRVFLGDSQRIWGARGVVSPLLGTTAMTDWPQGGVLPKWSYIPGCSLLTRADAYREAGGMPDRYKLYYEETHYCVQLQKRGWDLWIEASAHVRHMVHSMESGVPARHFAFYFSRNGLYFWSQNFGIPWYLQMPRTIPVIAKEVLLPLRKARSVAEAADRLKYALAGLFDGVSFLKKRYTYFESRLFRE